MKKFIVIIALTFTLVSFAIASNSLTSLFSKAFTKSLSPGEVYEKNITIRKYYNLTIRFQKENSTSYLAFDNNSTLIVLKDFEGKEIAKISGVVNGRAYILLDKKEIDRIKSVSVYNLGKYEDVENQKVNVTFYGTRAYLTVKVFYKEARISGFVFDELTKQAVEGIEILAFPKNSNPYTSQPVVQAITSKEGKYTLIFDLNSSKSFDIYVRGYEVS